VELAWDDVHLFLCVVRGGSLRAAARSLRVDVSTVSRRLSQLEQAAGTRLVVRDARGLELTAAGTHLVSSGERMARELAEVGRKIAGADRRLAGPVRVTAPSSLSELLGSAAAELARGHPGLELELAFADALVELDGARVDVAVRIADALPEHLVGARVGRLRAAVYAARASKITRLDDPELPWVEWDRRLAAKPAFAWLDASHPARRVAARGLGSAEVHALVRAGVGVGALPRLVGDGDPSLRRLAEVPDELCTAVWVLTHPELRDSPRVRAVTSCLRKVLKPRL
jgi:DNA-binding transcriptional LysR family regulator